MGRETDEINNNQKRFEIQLRNENIKEKQNKETIETLTIQLPTEKLWEFAPPPLQLKIDQSNHCKHSTMHVKQCGSDREAWTMKISRQHDMETAVFAARGDGHVSNPTDPIDIIGSTGNCNCALVR